MMRRLLRTRQWIPKQKLVGSVLGMFLVQKLIRGGYNDESTNNQRLTREQKLTAMNKLEKHTICRKEDVKEGEMILFELERNEKIYEFIVARVDGRLYSVGGKCVYDDETRLIEGELFGNKLICPRHGCSYNIKTGQAEYAPVLYDLARFHVDEKEGIVNIHVPKEIPKKIEFQEGYRDFNDLRKIIVVGNGMGSFKVCETLRSHSYTGELILFTQEMDLPYDKDKMFKDIGLTREQLLLKNEEWYERNGINYQLGRTITGINNTRGKPYVTMDDEIKVEYDSVVLQTGSNPTFRDIDGFTDQLNVQKFTNLQDYFQLQQALPNVKKLTVLGMNLKSLQLVSTIKQKFKDIEIIVVDENENDNIQDNFGRGFKENLINNHLSNGIKFIFKSKIKQFLGDEIKVDKIRFRDDFELDTDYILFFGNNFTPNFELLENTVNLEDFEYDNLQRMKTDQYCRSDHKRIFAIGSNTSMRNFLTDFHTKMKCFGYNMNMNQGQTVGYNLLALKIPFFHVPFINLRQFGTEYQIIGYPQDYDDIYIDGDIEKNNFICYYGFMDRIVGVIGTYNRNKELMVLHEGMRVNLLPSVDEMRNKEFDIATIRRAIQLSRLSGCFKNHIYNTRFKYNIKDSLWLKREVSDDYYDAIQKGYETFQNSEKTDRRTQ